MSKTNTTILFFDGVCGLCNGFIDFLFRFDRKKHFLFSPLQGEKAAELLPKSDTEKLESVVLYIDGKVFYKSEAALKVLTTLGGPWLLFGVFYILPKSFRDTVYSWIAKNRYKWFGEKESCRLPTPDERARFLS